MQRAEQNARTSARFENCGNGATDTAASTRGGRRGNTPSSAHPARARRTFQAGRLPARQGPLKRAFSQIDRSGRGRTGASAIHLDTAPTDRGKVVRPPHSGLQRWPRSASTSIRPAARTREEAASGDRRRAGGLHPELGVVARCPHLATATCPRFGSHRMPERVDRDQGGCRLGPVHGPSPPIGHAHEVHIVPAPLTGFQTYNKCEHDHVESALFTYLHERGFVESTKSDLARGVRRGTGPSAELSTIRWPRCARRAPHVATDRQQRTCYRRTSRSGGGAAPARETAATLWELRGITYPGGRIRIRDLRRELRHNTGAGGYAYITPALRPGPGRIGGKLNGRPSALGVTKVRLRGHFLAGEHEGRGGCGKAARC